MKLVNLQKIVDPYNYCDRWCERCLATVNCPVFKEGQEFRQSYLSQGKDPDSLEAVFEQVKESLGESLQLIEAGAKKWDIELELSEEDEIRYEEDEKQKEEFISNHQLYRLSLQWRDHALGLLGDFSEENFKSDPDLESILWFATLIPSKVYRALSSDFKDLVFDDFDDAEISAYIALRGINTSLEALRIVGPRYPQLAEEIELIVPLGRDLKFALKEFISGRSTE